MTFEQFMKSRGFDELDEHSNIHERVLYNTAHSCWDNRQVQIEYLLHSIDIYLGARPMLMKAAEDVERGAAYD